MGAPEAVEYGIVPAQAQPVQPRLSITGATVKGGNGAIDFVTIKQPDLDLLDWLAVRDNPAAELLSHHDVYGDETPSQQVQRGQQAMRTAKDEAEYVALKFAGYKPERVEGAVVVDYLPCLKASGNTCTEYAPVAKVLQPGDRITKVDGTTVGTLTQLRAALAPHKPGDTVKVTRVRPATGGGAETTAEVDVTLLAAQDDPTRAIIGFLPADTTTIKFPENVKINISTEGIGGPSAGAAFTLTVIDQLTDGNMLGGKTVAVTGTIDLDGNIGAIGGLPSKASAVMQAGAKYFLVPTEQGEADIAQARKVVGGKVQIIPVATITEALAALQNLGGDPVKPNVTT